MIQTVDRRTRPVLAMDVVHRRRRLGAVIGVSAILGAGAATVNAAGNFMDRVQEDHKLDRQLADPKAMEHYLDGSIDPSKVTIVVAPEEGVADQFGKDLHPEGNRQKLVDQIHAQTSANGMPGVQRGEEFVVEADQVQDSAAE